MFAGSTASKYHRMQNHTLADPITLLTTNIPGIMLTIKSFRWMVYPDPLDLEFCQLMRDDKDAEIALDLHETSRTLCGELPYLELMTWNLGIHHVESILTFFILRLADGKTMHMLK